MRWFWIDRVVEMDRGARCVAIKNVSLAEEVVHDHFAATATRGPIPVLPHTLVIEGMAQTAGILVGDARDFREKVILAKINKAQFQLAATPGHTLRFTARIERLDDAGAVTTGTVDLINSHTGEVRPMAAIDLTFSHVDQNRSRIAFPPHNFVFHDQFLNLLRQQSAKV